MLITSFLSIQSQLAIVEVDTRPAYYMIESQCSRPLNAFDKFKRHECVPREWPKTEPGEALATLYRLKLPFQRTCTRTNI